MNRLLPLSASALLFLSVAAQAASTPVHGATVMIANYSENDVFLGWGSGFFVDEGIVVTNKHVIEGGDWYRVFPTDAADTVDFACGKNITRSDVKMNLADDVAYMRVYLSCPHDVIRFADEDPPIGTAVSVVGYRYKGSIEQSLTLTTTTGSVTGTQDGWILTTASMDIGNSGGPVVHNGEVVGVSVAKGVDAEGNFITGYFVPTSVILDGLLYANDPRFGYTPQSRASSQHSSSSSSFQSSIRSSSSSSRRSSVVSSGRSSSRSSARLTPIEKISPQFKIRTCERVLRWFRNDSKMLSRVNARLEKRFGFTCP